MKTQQIILAMALAGAPLVQAASLPDGALLTLTPGVISDDGTRCVSGSCFGLESFPGLYSWTAIAAGTDGGIIIGKQQLSGGQQYGPSTDIATDGEMTAAWLFFGTYGTFFTDPFAHLNLFDDTSCVGTDCIGRTELNTMQVAWNGTAVEIGAISDNDPAWICSALPAEVNWTVSGNTYVLDLFNDIPTPAGSGSCPFVIQNMVIHLEGEIVESPCSLDQYPIVQATTEGGGQGPAINTTLQTMFTGQITTTQGLTNGGMNSVKICPGSKVAYDATTTTGKAVCWVNGVAGPASGRLGVGDKLICSNKPDGSDIDRFTVKSGL